MNIHDRIKKKKMKKFVVSDLSETSLNYYAQHFFLFLNILRVYKSDRHFSKVFTLGNWFSIIILLFGNLMIVLSGFIGLKDTGSFKVKAKIFGLFTFHLTGMVKWCYCILRRERIQELMNLLHHCHNLSTQIDPEKLDKEMRFARKLVRFSSYYWPIIGISAVLLYSLNPAVYLFYQIYVKKLSNNQIVRELPLLGWFPADKDEYFEFYYIIQTIGIIGCSVGALCYDQLYMATLPIVSCQLKFLSESLKSEIVGSNPEKFSLSERLMKCTELHARLLEYIEQLETVGSPCMFLQCVHTIIIICMTSFEYATLELTPDANCVYKISSLTEFSAGITMQLFVFCLNATLVEVRGSDIANAVYHCPWTNYQNEFDSDADKKERRKIKFLILMISLRAQKPIILTGGPFYILSLETFRAIMGMAFSNSLILSQLYS